MPITLATTDQSSEIRACAEAAYARYIPLMGRKPAPLLSDYDAQTAEGLIHVATKDGHVAGFIVFYPKNGAMLLENIAVHPDYAGHGIGKALIQYCEAEARAQRLSKVQLYTNSKMTENLAIYPHLGFTEIDRRTSDGFDRMFFEKSLI